METGPMDDFPVFHCWTRGAGKSRLGCDAEVDSSSMANTGVDLPALRSEKVEPLETIALVMSTGIGGKLWPIDCPADTASFASVLGRFFKIPRIDVLDPFFLAPCGVAKPARMYRTASRAGVSSAFMPISLIAPLKSARKSTPIISGRPLSGPRDEPLCLPYLGVIELRSA